ncbi:MAG: hypothetical protein RL069_876, partial [Planctomycetota bacterium]
MRLPSTNPLDATRDKSDEQAIEESERLQPIDLSVPRRASVHDRGVGINSSHHSRPLSSLR